MVNELVDILLLYLMAVVNASLRAGYLPASQKTATLWRAPMSCCHSAVEEVITRRYRAQEHRRPICRLSRKRSIELLLSTLFRTYDWLISDLLWRFQWAYGRHSTETALLRVASDIYAAIERQDVTLIIL